MEGKKHSISIGENLYKDLKEYCELNSLKMNEFVESLLKDAFMVEKYGDAPFFTKPNISEPEVKRETIVAVPLKSDVVDSNGRIYTEQAISEALKNFKQETQITVNENTGEVFLNTNHTSVQEVTIPEKQVTENKPKRKVTKLK